MIKEISLFEHNEKAYEALVSSLAQNPLAFIEHATGTGKSFILLKYLYMKMRDKRILFITRHYEMLNQLFNEQMKTLGLSKEDFNKFDSIIYPNILDLNMREVIQNYDCIVWDEAHHCGAPKWSIKVNEAKELVKNTPGKVMIGTTATRFRFLDNYMDVAEKFFDGKIVSILPATKAILQNLLPAPFIIMTTQSCLERIETLLKKLHKIPQVPIVKSYQDYIENLKKQITDEFYIGNILKTYGVKSGEKYIVFCSNINDIKIKMKEASKWFKDIGSIKIYTAHSGQKRSINIKQINDFSQKREEISLMFAVDIFNEGFHIEGVNGIFNFRKTKSPNVYWQQLGRALSFSARKMQIKVYDFANNTSDNKIIYELYKEMLEEARKLIFEDPENKAIYEKIISRFQIIDQTTAVLEKLNEIESKIDQDFIIKSRIDLAISKLKEYRSLYPNTDFNNELLNKRLAYDYVKAYNYICELEDYLTNDQITNLEKLHITFTAKINLPQKKRLELLGENKNFKELEDKKIEEFIKNYIEFCQKNNRRPNIDDDKNLYLSYREFLKNMSRSKLNKFLALIPFSLTLEEIIILGDYPSENDIINYIEMLKTKIEQNIPLDAIEIKVLGKISHAIPSKYTNLLDYLNNCHEISYKIDEAIITLRNCQKKENILDSKSYKKALRIINQYALRITNKQFAEILELRINLPSKINMTMEKRLKELKGFDSFYAKRQSENMGIMKSYLLFLQENKRRPSLANEKEAKLEREYEEKLFKTTSSKIREITDTLLDLDITLTLEEAILAKYPVDKKDIENYILKIRNKVVHNEKITKIEIKMLRAIAQSQYSLKISINNFLKMIINIDNIDKMLDNYELSEANNYQKENILYNVFHKAKFLTANHLERLKALNINIPHEIIDYLAKYPEYLNIFERDTKIQESFWNEFFDYLEKNKEYPERNSPLTQKYREYLSYISIQDAKMILSKIKEMGICLGIEEKILLNDTRGEIKDNLEEIKSYLKGIQNKFKNNESLDSLEIRIWNLLDMHAPKMGSMNSSSDIESREIENIKANIRLNPFEPIDLEHNYAISKQNRQKLETYRINILGKQVLEEILNIIKKEKKPISEILDENYLSLYNSFLSNQNMDTNNKYLINQIKSLDHEYKLRQKGFTIANFINEYINFIEDSHGIRPNISSENESEKNLAITYEEVHDILDDKDIDKIEKALKSIISEEETKTFFQRLIVFINEFGRFPCGNSDNSYEIYLNMLYQNIGTNLSKEEKNEIKKLKKIYGKATIQAGIEFSKQNKPRI